MDWCRVVGPCPPLDEKRGVPTNNPPHPTSVNTCKHLSWQGKSPSKAGRWQRQAFLLGSETGSPVRTGPAGPESLALEARAIKPWNLPAFGPRPSWGCAYRPRKKHKHPLSSIAVVTAVLVYPEALFSHPPSPFCRDARPGASVGASSAHVNGQRRSWQFTV